MGNMKSHCLWVKATGYCLFLCGLLAGLSAQPVMAYEPDPNFWYVETVTLDASGLPPDFHVYTAESNAGQLGEGVWLTTNNPASSLQATIYFINNSETPIYVLSLEYRDRLVMATPDESYAARVRTAHEVASYLIPPTLGLVDGLVWEELKDLDHSLIGLNPPSFNPLPAEVVPPPVQHSELLMVYGEQVVLLPFTISYTVNQNFKIEEYLGPAGVPDPTMVPESNDVLNTGQKAALVSSGVILVAAIAWLVWRWRSKH